MSERLDARSELLKLARVLSVADQEIAFLEELPAAQLREFREQVTNRLFDSSSGLLRRIGSAAKLIPSGLVATIAQRAFGPLLCARAATAVDPHKAIDVVGRLPPSFLADTAIEVDPRRVAEIIAGVPTEVVVPVAAELGRRSEHVTMGRFLGFVTDEAIVAAIATLDDEALLRTAFVLEHKDRLDHAIGLLPAERLPSILRRATELGLWPEALDLLDQLSDAHRGPIADIVAEQDQPVIAGIVEAVAEAGIWDSLLPVVGLMSDAARRRLATAPAFHEPDVMREILRVADANDLWADLLPLVDALPQEVRGPIVEIVAGQDDGVIDRIVWVAVSEGLWLELVPLVEVLSEPAHAKLLALIDGADRRLAEELVASLADPGEAGSWLKQMPPELQAAVARAADRLGMQEVLEDALAQADSR